MMIMMSAVAMRGREGEAAWPSRGADLVLASLTDDGQV